MTMNSLPIVFGYTICNTTPLEHFVSFFKATELYILPVFVTLYKTGASLF